MPRLRETWRTSRCRRRNRRRQGSQEGQVQARRCMMIAGGVVLAGGGRRLAISFLGAWRRRTKAAETHAEAKPPTFTFNLPDMIVNLTISTDRPKLPEAHDRARSRRRRDAGQRSSRAWPRSSTLPGLSARAAPEDLEGSAGCLPPQGRAAAPRQPGRSIRPRSMPSCSKNSWSSKALCPTEQDKLADEWGAALAEQGAGRREPAMEMRRRMGGDARRRQSGRRGPAAAVAPTASSIRTKSTACSASIRRAAASNVELTGVRR